MRNAITTLLLLSASINAADWSTFRADNRRSGTSTDQLNLPLTQKWKHDGKAPEQAWSGPAKWDAYAGNSGLQSMRNFDPCHYVTIANDNVYYGSSSDNAVHCIDIKTGKELWAYFTNGAVSFQTSSPEVASTQ